MNEMYKYLLIIALLGLIFSWVGVALFGMVLVGGFLFAFFFSVFIPIILFGIAVLVGLGKFPVPGQYRLIAVVALILLAAGVAFLPGGAW